MARSVAHEDEGSSGCFCRIEAVEAGFLHGLFRNRLCNGLLVIIGHCPIFPDFAQQGFRYLHRFEVSFMSLHHLAKFIIFRPVHEVGGLNDEILHPVRLGTGQGLIHIVNLFPVPGIDMIDDNLGRKSPSYGISGISCSQGLFHPTDIFHPAVVEGSAEGNGQKLVLSDSVLIQRVIHGSISCIPPEIVGVRILSGNQGLLGIRQGIPGGLRFFTLLHCIIIGFLHIDGIDQGRHLVRSRLVGIGLISAAGEKTAGQCKSCEVYKYLFLHKKTSCPAGQKALVHNETGCRGSLSFFRECNAGYSQHLIPSSGRSPG